MFSQTPFAKKEEKSDNLLPFELRKIKKTVLLISKSLTRGKLKNKRLDGKTHEMNFVVLSDDQKYPKD